jgi:outer membrane protein OmpA-like peptidoglycan-associated protein
VAGSTGAEGPSRVGPTGPVGATGATGAQGSTGFAGAQGDTQMAGVAGPTGRTGAAGPQGSVGQTGARGPGGTDAMSSWTPFRDIWFDRNRSDLRNSERSKVSDIANYLNQNPGQQVGIDGTSERTTSVRNALLQAGVPSYKIQTGNFGDSRMQRDRQVQVLVSSR